MRRKYVIVLCSVLSALIIGVGALSFTYARRARRAENTLRVMYESAVMGSLKHLEELQWHIDKAMLSQHAGASAQLLSAVSSGAAGVRESLSLLPTSQESVLGALKFANQLQDYADMLTGQVENGVTESQMQTLEQLSTACENMKSALENARAAWEKQDVGVGERTLGDEQVQYPTLIYDGPFSDVAEDGKNQLANLPEITQAQSLEIARIFLGEDSQVQPGTDIFGPIPCYGVTAEQGGVTLQLAVTKQGGKVLWMFPEHGNFESLLTLEQCRENALQFLSQHGYTDMEPLHFQVYEGVAVLNFAAIQDGVILYPDQVKVQLRMDTGKVVGVECRNYLTHHTVRSGLTPSITPEEAMGMLSGKLALSRDPRLTLIPQNQQETLCYEFAGHYKGEEYLVYINAHHGEQEEILKVVETTSGLEAV